MRQEAIRTTSGSERLILTEHGKQIVRESAVLSPSEQTIWFPFDGLLRRPKWYGGTAFLKPNEAKERGLPQLKAIPARGPTADELSAADVSEVIRLAVGGSRGEREVLPRGYVESAFGSSCLRSLSSTALSSKMKVQVSFAIDGRISQEHELRSHAPVAWHGNRSFRGCERVRPPLKDILGGRVAEMVVAAEDLRQKAAHVTTSRSAVDAASLAVIKAESDDQRAEAAEAEKLAREELAQTVADLQRLGPTTAGIRASSDSR